MSEPVGVARPAGAALREITFEGRPIPVAEGQSIGAALMAAGVRAWRTTRVNGRPRGLFCGIGVCFDCLVTVNGRPLRACVTEACPGDAVTGCLEAAADPREGGGR